MFWLSIDRGKISKTTLFLCLCVLTLASNSYATVKYSVIDLGTLPNGYNSYAYGINKWGQVVGGADLPGDSDAFLWQNGVMYNLEDLAQFPAGWDSVESKAIALNDKGEIVFTAEHQQEGCRTFLYKAGMVIDLGIFGGNNFPYGINNAGQVVGGFWSSPYNTHPFFWSEDSGMIDLIPTSYYDSYAFGINDSGQVVGRNGDTESAFLWEKGVMQYMGGQYSGASSVNSMGQIAGGANFGWKSHAVLWENGVMTDLGVLNGGYFDRSEASAINNFGQIVGYSSFSNTSASSRAFLWTNGTMYDLNALIPNGTGWILHKAYGINDAGQIVGFGINPAGEQHGFLLTPTSWPPPQLYAVICGNDDGAQLFGKDAEAIYNVLLEYPGVKKHNLKLVANLNALYTTIPEIVEKLQPWDQFWFYYSGHGEYGADGTEPAVWNSPLVALITGDLKNEGDEYLSSIEGAVSDDGLATWLSSHPKMEDVRKVVILDSCMSGGFWGREGNESDEGDLDKLKNIGLITACDEAHFAYSYPDWSWLGDRRGRGMFSFVLEKQLRRGDGGVAPADLNGDGAVSFQELITAMRAAYTIEEGTTGVIRIFPWLEEDIEVEIDPNEIPEVYVNHSVDFDPNVLIIPKKPISDLDNDWDVDFSDLAVLTSFWLDADCNSPAWCWGADLDRSGVVNFIDFGILAEDWLWAKIPADIDFDGDVDFQDFAIFALAWLTEEGQIGYDSNCDIALPYDGAIDEKDLQIFSDNWLLGR